MSESIISAKRSVEVVHGGVATKSDSANECGVAWHRNVTVARIQFRIPYPDLECEVVRR